MDNEKYEALLDEVRSNMQNNPDYLNQVDADLISQIKDFYVSNGNDLDEFDDFLRGVTRDLGGSLPK